MIVQRFNLGTLGSLYFYYLGKEEQSKFKLNDFIILPDESVLYFDDLKLKYNSLYIGGELAVSYNEIMNRIEIFDFNDDFKNINNFKINNVYTISDKVQETVSSLNLEGAAFTELRKIALVKVPVLTCFFAIKILISNGVNEFSNAKVLLLACDNFRRLNLFSFTRHIAQPYIKEAKDLKVKLNQKIFDLYCDAQKYDSSILKDIYYFLRLVGDNYYLLVNLGTIYFNLGELELCDLYYKKARLALRKTKIDVDSITPFNKGFINWISLNEWNKELMPPIHKEYQLFPVNRNQVSCVHMVSADVSYFNLYGESLINSSLDNAFDGFVVHINVINPSDQIITKLQTFQDLYPSIFSYSVERIPDERCSKAYYASSRYIHLYKLMKLYKSAIFVTDIDMRVNTPWAITYQKYRKYDICLHSKKNVDLKNYLSIQGRPWSIPAGYVFINAKEPGVKFSNYIASYILSNYRVESKNHTNWVIDQVAIRRSLDALINENQNFLVGRLSCNFMNAPRKSVETKLSWINNVNEDLISDKTSI
ncbi:hypothetical protein ACJJH9_03215 [Microbulbifer sp. DLAB2-AF]|uniref:hypothetical protein n=1 Tax=Microbulbifer sp. DLAB2-AF TaxID=3243395 RepID=UPI004039C48A